MNTHVLHFPCGDPLCEEGDDCVAVHLIREKGNADLELAPWWRAAVVDAPLCGVPLREHRVEELRALAEERMAQQEAKAADDRLLDRLWSEELDRYCHRCDEPMHKCSCADLEDWIADRWAGAS